ncbi:hypothetical protein RYO59_002593 [Thermosynechococcaceae cyanobacterium Okahandja]
MLKLRLTKPLLLGLGVLVGGTIAALSVAQQRQMMTPHHTPDAHTPHHDGHGHGGTEPPHHSSTSTSRAQLLKATDLSPNQSITLTLGIRNAAGQPVKDFERFQEALMHLIIVSDDLQVFQHLHPTYQGQGQFQVTTTLPQGGGYTLIADYKPAGESETVSTMPLQLMGAPPTPAPFTPQLQQTVANTLVTLELPQPLSTGATVELRFQLRDAGTNEPLKDLQPYLGEAGHLVILRATTPLQEADYLHAHALDTRPTDTVRFATQFPKAGRYKLWAQFQRGQTIVTAPFWVTVN